MTRTQDSQHPDYTASRQQPDTRNLDLGPAHDVLQRLSPCWRASRSTGTRWRKSQREDRVLDPPHYDLGPVEQEVERQTTTDQSIPAGCTESATTTKSLTPEDVGERRNCAFWSVSTCEIRVGVQRSVRFFLLLVLCPSSSRFETAFALPIVQSKTNTEISQYPSAWYEPDTSRPRSGLREPQAAFNCSILSFYLLIRDSCRSSSFDRHSL